MTKSKIFLFLLLAFIAGVAIRSFTLVPYFLFWFGLAVSFGNIIYGVWQKRKMVVLGGFLFLAALAGIFRFDLHNKSQPDLTDFYGQPLVLRGIVVAEPERKENAQRLKIEVKTVEKKELKSYFYTLITVRPYPAYQIGDELEINGLLQKPENYSDFDYVSYLVKENIFSTMYFPLLEKKATDQGNKIRLWLARIKHSLEEKIDMILPEPHSAFLKGLLLGERESLPVDLVLNFQRTGTAHIVALSGYNITLVARFFLFILLYLTVPYYLSFWVASLAIIFFVIMVGASPSVVRAAIMGILVLLAGREGRPYHMTNALIFAGAIMIWQNPKILKFDAAFQLSFLATVGLIFLPPRLKMLWVGICRWLVPDYDRLGRKQEFGSQQVSLKRIFIETLSAQLAVLPLLVYLFGRVSLLSPLVNMLILLVVPYAMVFGFMAGIAAFIYYPLGQILGWVVWIFLEYKIKVINFFADLSWVSVEVTGRVGIVLMIFYIWFLWALFKKSKRAEP